MLSAFNRLQCLFPLSEILLCRTFVFKMLLFNSLAFFVQLFQSQFLLSGGRKGNFVFQREVKLKQKLQQAEINISDN